jgi:hypothetical protein
MDGKPGAFDRDESHDREDRPDDDALSAWLTSLPPCPGIPSTPTEIAISHDRARADSDAGRVYPHAIVGEWLKTWGKPGRRPFQDWLADTRG